jgi:hypothetical protein
MKFKSIRVMLFISLLLLSSCESANKTSSEQDISISEDHKEIISIEESKLDGNEKKIFESLKKDIKLANQIIDEADLIIAESQLSDELEGALETMDIATNEVIKILAEFENYSDISNTNLKGLEMNIKKSLEDYQEGMKMQFDGITNQDSQINKEGFLLTDRAKKEIRNYGSKLNGIEK